MGVAVTQLRPFFGYFGGKWRDALRNYPAPQHGTIVEPFAGSAGYSLRYPAKRVILCEIDSTLAGIWDYLISVSAEEVRAIPDVPLDGTVDDLDLPPEAKALVGMWLNRGVARPRRSPSKWMRDRIRPGSFWGERVRQTIASQLEHIRHWEIHNCDYQKVPVADEATWFIDPPYVGAGHHYRHGASALDFSDLATWCRARPGQVIVCENEGADWLPFRHLGSFKTTRSGRHSKEVYWLNRWDTEQPAAEKCAA
jgi:site-specific DNA-adenine methylase